MIELRMFSRSKITELTSASEGSTKFGERVLSLDVANDMHIQLIRSTAKYVLLIIPEIISDTRDTTKKKWGKLLVPLLNTQHNSYNKGHKVLMLGSLSASENLTERYRSVEDKEEKKELQAAIKTQLNKEISHLSYLISSAGKKMIVISESQENAYGILKGVSLANNKAVNVINLDTLPDFDADAQNGFGLAFKEKFLGNYFVFGIDESKVKKQQLSQLGKYPENIKFNTFEAVEIRQEKSFPHEMNEALAFIDSAKYGVEVDSNILTKFPSSRGKNHSGYDFNKVRSFVSFFKRSKNSSYMHISEIAPDFDDQKAMQKTSELISYLVTDFI